MPPRTFAVYLINSPGRGTPGGPVTEIVGHFVSDCAEVLIAKSMTPITAARTGQDFM